ncbi:tape measure protein [Acinetobacter baumannii]|uniref:tape measure protein n=1 Tax=Acinetobacter baumannii TaxID=470 RepID=UPI001EE81D1C|nr:tape measure protein [Acinetobacter baumannii]MCG5790308.1 tape measure protein [Acinetobacter baumannii]
MAQESRLVIVIDSQNAERNARNLGNELNSIEKNGDFATKSMDRMSVATRSLAGYMAGVVTIGSAISKMDLYTGINNKLKLVTNNQEELNLAMNDTFEIAQRSASSWSAVNDVYSKYMSNAKTLNLTQEQTAKLTEITSKAVAISGSNSESAAAALFQYGQALDGGVLRAEEFNSLVDGAGGLLNAMAKGLGVTRGELRQMMLDGKLTGEVITKALLKAGDSVEQLYGKTNKTISQSLEMLSNGITKFVGETGQGSGAAQSLAGSIQILAENLDLIVDGAFVLGIGLMTKAVLTKTVAIQASIVASAQQRAANLAEAQSQVQLLGVEAMRARQSAALALTEIGLARAEYNAAITADARAIAVQRKTAAEVAHSVALKEATAATAAYTVAQGNLNRVATLGSRALGLVGGPIGAITIGITALAAGYMYFQDKAAKANKKLEEQAEVAKRAKDELLALRGLEKDSAINDMSASLERQNQALADSSSKINIQLNAIAQLYKGNKEIVEVVNEAKDGTISMNDAVKRFNDLKINKEVYDSFKANAEIFQKNSVAAQTTQSSLKLLGQETKVAGNAAQNAAVQRQNHAKAIEGEANAATTAEQKLKKLREEANKSMLNDQYWINTYNRNKNILGEAVAKDFADFSQEWRKTNKIGSDITLTKEQNQVLQEQWQLHLKIAAIRDEATAATKEQNKALRDQQKVLTVNAKVLANAEKYNFAEIEAKNNLPSGTLSAIHMIESKGNARAYNKETGATGGFQFLEGTAKQYGVKDRNDLAQSAEGAGKYMSYLLKLFKGDIEKAVRAYHAGEGNVQKGKGIGKNNNQYWKDYQGYMAGINGYTAGDISSKDFDGLIQEATKMAEEQANLRLKLENDVADQVTKIRNDLSKKLEEVDKANFSPERKGAIKAELQARADNDIAIAEQATKTKLDSFRDFTKSEEQLLKESFAKRQFDAEHDLELTKEQRKEAVDILAQQLTQEIALVKLAQEQRLFQARLTLLSETQAMQERYRLEREEILQNTKLSIEERQKLIAFSKANQDKETRNKVNNAIQNWGGIQAEMNGSSEFFRQDQERFSRLGAANDLADSQYAATDLNEQNGLDSLNAQMEAGLIQQQDFENQKTAIIQAAQEQRSQIYSDYAQNVKDVEDKYQQDRLNAQIALGGQMMGSVTSMFGSMFGEQSKAYKLMFAADKAYAIAAAGIAIQQNIAAASKVGFPYNLPLIAGAVAQGASIIANIRAIKDQGFSGGGFTGYGGKYEPAGIVHRGEVVWSQEDIRRWGGVGLVENMRKSSSPEAFINNHATNNTSAENVFNRSFLSSKAFNDNQNISNIFNQPTRENLIILNALKPSKDTVSRSGDVQSITNQYAGNNSNISNVLEKSIQSSKSFTANKSNLTHFSNSKIQNSNVSNSTVQNAQKELLKDVAVFRDGAGINPVIVDGSKGFAKGGFTGRGKKDDVAGAVHRNEIVWSQDDIRNWGGVEKVEQMRKATSPDSFISNYAQNNTSFENIMNRANQSSQAFNRSRDISNIFNESYQDGQIIYKGNSRAPTASSSASSDLFHDGKVYFSSNGLVQDRSNLEDVQDFTSGQSPRPQAEFIPSFEQSSPTINFKIEVVNQVSGATVEAEQLDEKTVRIIVKEELDKQLPKAVPRLVSEDIKNPNSLISRSLTANTTARRNRT